VFYFTRFHEHTTEKDLWVHFKKWGDVREILIPNHSNKGGRRFGFARFKGVTDERKLERQLDNLRAEGLKLYVNLPKYGRQNERFAEHIINLRTQKEGRSVGHRLTQHRTLLRIYTNVAATIPMDVEQRKQPPPRNTRHMQSQSTVQLDVQWGERNGLQKHG